MIDIDKFKNINDKYGHDIGDIAIKEVAKILHNNLRACDLVARFGGEEFCILLEDISSKDLEIMFERIRKNFEENIININEISINYTVSFGIAYGILDSLNDMVTLSDEALYYSKKNGRNRVTIKVTH
jgi:diguanylate cyclase (GGDEF)-like protein